MALRPRGVITASSGNHGRAVALAARRAGIPAAVVMTPDASPYKRAGVESLGARVIDSAPGVSERNRMAAEVGAAEGLTYIPPYDHPLVLAGQGTVGLEIAADAPDVRTVVVPVGGGGLISGIATALRARLGAAVRIVGVEPLAGNDFMLSRAAGARITVPLPQTICDGARTDTPGELTFPIVQALVDDVIAVPDEEVIAAMALLARGGIYAEPTGSLAVAGAVRLGLGDGTVCVVSGRNIDFPGWAELVGVSAARG